jgi:hypothetical protein
LASKNASSPTGSTKAPPSQGGQSGAQVGFQGFPATSAYSAKVLDWS